MACGGGGGGGISSSAEAAKVGALFNDVLQRATTQARLPTPEKNKAIISAVHGKDADTKLVEHVQRLYLKQVLSDSKGRLRVDPDLQQAPPEQFPHIRAWMESN